MQHHITQHRKTIVTTFTLLTLIFVLTPINSLIAAEDKSTTLKQPADPVFAKINDKVILYSEFIEIFQNAVRYKYYHGEVPEEELIKFQKQVGSDIVKQILINQEAIKLGLTADMDKISSGIDDYEQKYRDDPRWEKFSDAAKIKMTERLKQKDLFDQMKIMVRNIPHPSDKEVLEFYNNNPDKFTEPKRIWVSVILLSVPPSSSNQVWNDAEITGKKFKFQIEEGEEFADMARRFSAHPSAVNGGDLGYLHEGMLDGEAAEAVNKLKIGEISNPIRVLEGFTVFKMNGIQPAKLRPFDEVKQRAAGLLYRQLQDQKWEEYQANLIDNADIQVNEKLYAASRIKN